MPQKSLVELVVRGVPVNALLLSAVGIGIASIVYTINPASAFPIMIALSMFGALFTWGSIFVTHMFLEDIWFSKIYN